MKASFILFYLFLKGEFESDSYSYIVVSPLLENETGNKSFINRTTKRNFNTNPAIQYIENKEKIKIPDYVDNKDRKLLVKTKGKLSSEEKTMPDKHGSDEKYQKSPLLSKTTLEINSEAVSNYDQCSTTCSELEWYIPKNNQKIDILSKGKIIIQIENEYRTINLVEKKKVEDLKLKANKKHYIYDSRIYGNCFERICFQSAAFEAKLEAIEKNKWIKCDISFSNIFRKEFNDLDYYISKKNHEFTVFRQSYPTRTLLAAKTYRFLIVKGGVSMSFAGFGWYAGDVYIMDPKGIGNNVTLHGSTYIDMGCKIGSNTVVQEKCIFERNIIIPDNSYIGSKNYFRNRCNFNYNIDIKENRETKTLFSLNKIPKCYRKYYRKGVITYIGDENYFGSNSKFPRETFIGHRNIIGSNFEALESIKIIEDNFVGKNVKMGKNSTIGFSNLIDDNYIANNCSIITYFSIYLKIDKNFYTLYYGNIGKFIQIFKTRYVNSSRMYLKNPYEYKDYTRREIREDCKKAVRFYIQNCNLEDGAVSLWYPRKTYGSIEF